jgi:uncharacterized membrane protein YphA (DoxX/SURF4 family)
MTQASNSAASNSAWWILKIAFGVTAFLAGLDKFLGLLADWPAYVAPWVTNLLPLTAPSLMKIVGVVEMAAGLLVLSKFTKLGALVVAAWLTLVALQLLSTGGYRDIAVRDLVMAASAFALARLSEDRAS